MPEEQLALKHSAPEGSWPDRIVILGAGGFVAPRLAKGLAGENVQVLSIGSADVDLTDPGAAAKLSGMLRPADTVVMTSALTPDKGKDIGTLTRNLKMADSLVGALPACPLGHLIYFSSDAVYGPTSGVLSERSPAAPVDLYGIMHLAREIALREAAGKHGMPFCILRPTAIYGQGDTHNGYGPNRFFRSARAEKRITLIGEGEETRDHVYIHDVVALTKLAVSRRSAGTLNVISGHAVSFADLAQMISRALANGTVIQTTPRKNPVTHRPFDHSLLSQSFPGFLGTSLKAGLAAMAANP